MHRLSPNLDHITQITALDRPSRSGDHLIPVRGRLFTTLRVSYPVTQPHWKPFFSQLKLKLVLPPGPLQRLCLLPESCLCTSSPKYQFSRHLLGGAFQTLWSGLGFSTKHSSRATSLFHLHLLPFGHSYLSPLPDRMFQDWRGCVSCRTTVNLQYLEQHLPYVSKHLSVNV